MDRLTVTNQNIGSIDSSTLPSYVALYERLKEYEDLEEQGKLLKLPVVVGDTVYCIRQSWSGYLIDKKMFKIGMMDKFGKTVFLSREEAEAALKEMGE